jgi:hypothetical protein
MGIGRREFLVQFGSAIAVLASAGRAAAFVEDLYLDREHGIAFRCPPGWKFENLAEVRRTKAGMLLDLEGFDTERWAEFIRTDQTYAAFVVVADMARARSMPGWQGPGDPDVIAPGISVQFEGTWEDDGPAPGTPFSLAAFVEQDLRNFRRAYPFFRLHGPPTERRISEAEAIEYVAEYGFRHANLAVPVPMRERVLYVHQNPAIYSIRMWDYPTADPPLVHDFESFIPTIRIL